MLIKRLQQMLTSKILDLNNNASSTIVGVLISTLCFHLPVLASDAAVKNKNLNVNSPQDKQDSIIGTSVSSNKSELIEKILYNSSVTKRIESSENEKAIALLEEARKSYLESAKLLEEGRKDAADKKLDDSLRLLQTASSYVTDPNREETIMRQRYEQLGEMFVTFREAYDRIEISNDIDTDSSLDNEHLHNLVAQANEFERNKNYSQAAATMEEAVNLLKMALSTALDKKTIIHEFRFDTVEDEYRYEMEVNQSYIKLLKFILDNLDRSSDRYALIENLLQRNDQILAEANLHVTSGEMKSALASLEQGNIELMRLIRSNGI